MSDESGCDCLHTVICFCLNNYGFQRIKIDNFLHIFYMSNIVCFDSLKATFVQTNGNCCK